MNNWEAIGYVASTLVLTAFGMKSIIPLRVVAMCSNLMFIIYGLGLRLTPIWCLHAALLPMNAWRLVEALGARNGAHLLRQAADDESIVGGSMIPWLRNRAQPKLAETQRLGAEKHAVAFLRYHLTSRADLARAFAGKEVEKKWGLHPFTVDGSAARRPLVANYIKHLTCVWGSSRIEEHQPRS